MAKATALTNKYVVLDASVVVSVCSKEPKTFAKAEAELSSYATAGCEFFAPGAIIAEVLYALCLKVNRRDLTAAEHGLAVQAFIDLMKVVKPPPNGDVSLIQRAEQI